MNTKVIKNAYWIIACRILQSLLNLFIGMLSARYLGPSNYGTINYIASIVTFITPLMNLGLNEILVQEFVSKDKSGGETLGTAISLGLMSSFFCVTGIVSFSMLTAPSEMETTIVCALYSTVLFFQAIQLCVYWYQAHYLAKYSSIISLIAYTIVSIYRIFLMITNKSIYWFAVVNSIDHILIAFALLVLYKRKSGERLAFSVSTAKRLLKKSKYYIIPGIMVNIFTQTDKIMIKFILGTVYTGYYSAAVNCASITAFVFVAIIDSFRPIIFKKIKTNTSKFEHFVTQLYSIIIYFSLTQCVLITLLAKPIIAVLYGTEYSAAISALRIIVWYTTFSYLGAVRNIWILANNLQNFLVYINLAGCIANVALNMCLIPIMGIDGAALASLVTQIFTNVIIGFIKKPIRRNNYLMIKGLNIRVLGEIINKEAIKSIIRER